MATNSNISVLECTHTNIVNLFGFTIGQLDSVPAHYEYSKERKYGKLSVTSIGCLVWDSASQDFNPVECAIDVEVPSSPIYEKVADKLSVIFLDTQTTDLINTIEKAKRPEGEKRLAATFARLKDNGWKAMPMSNLKTTRIMVGDKLKKFGMLFVARTNPMSAFGTIHKDKWVKSGNYLSVRRWLQIEPMTGATIIKVPVTASDGLSYTRKEYVPHNFLGRGKLKVAGHTSGGKYCHLKGVLKIFSTKDELGYHFTKKWFKANKAELVKAHLPVDLEGMNKLAKTHILVTDDEAKIHIPEMGQSRKMDIVVFDDDTIKKEQGTTCFQMLTRTEFENPEEMNDWVLANVRRWVVNISTLKGTMEELNVVLSDEDEDFDEGREINRLELSAATSILKLFNSMSVDEKHLERSMDKVSQALLRKLSRLVLPMINIRPVVLDSLKQGEIAMGPQLARTIGKIVNRLTVDGFLTADGAPLHDGDRLMGARPPYLPGSLRNLTVKILLHLTDIGVSPADAKMWGLDCDGDLLALTKFLAGGVKEITIPDGDCKYHRTMPASKHKDIRVRNVMNANMGYNIGPVDNDVSRMVANFGANHAETILMAHKSLQSVINLQKPKGDETEVMDIPATRQAMDTDKLAELPDSYWLLRGKSKWPSMSSLAIGAGSLTSAPGFPEHIRVLIDELNKGTEIWSDNHDWKADKARWTLIQEKAQLLVSSEWYETAFGIDHAAGKNGFFLRHIRNPLIKRVETLYDKASHLPKNVDPTYRKRLFDLVRSAARHAVDARVNSGITSGVIQEKDREVFSALIRALVLSRFWAAGFFCYSIVTAFTFKEAWISLRVTDHLLGVTKTQKSK